MPNKPPYKYIPNLDGGYNPSDPSNLLKDEESPSLKNLIFEEGLVKVDTGYSSFGSAILGYPQKVFQLFKKAGGNILLLFTTLTAYEWSTTEEEWQLICSNNASTLTNATTQAAGTTGIIVDDSSLFSVGATMGVILDNGTQHITGVNAVSDSTHITMYDAVPTGRSISDNAKVIRAPALYGDLDNLVSCAVWVPNDDLIFSNYSTGVKYFDSSEDTIRDVEGLPSSGNCRAKVVRVLENHVCLYGTIEGGSSYPQRVRSCDTGDPTDWSTGNAGFQDLWDKEDFILAAEHLGPYISIYREKSIYRQSYVGSASTLFSFNEMVSGEGVLGTEAVAVLKDFHLVLGNTSIFKYDGGMNLIDIGGKISRNILSQGGRLNPEYKGRSLAFLVEELRETWFLIPTGSSTVPDLLLRVKVDGGAWSLREFYCDFIGYGFYKETVNRTWSDLSGSWIEQSWKWNSRRMLVGLPHVMLCSHDPKQIMEYDFITVNDNEQVIEWEFQTKDFSNPHVKLRMNLLEIFANGATVKVSRSHDNGVTWTFMETVTLSSTLNRYRVWKQFVDRLTRFKFSGQGGGFSLQWLGMDYNEESDW